MGYRLLNPGGPQAAARLTDGWSHGLETLGQLPLCWWVKPGPGLVLGLIGGQSFVRVWLE